MGILSSLKRSLKTSKSTLKQKARKRIGAEAYGKRNPYKLERGQRYVINKPNLKVSNAELIYYKRPQTYHWEQTVIQWDGNNWRRGAIFGKSYNTEVEARRHRPLAGKLVSRIPRDF